MKRQLPIICAIFIAHATPILSRTIIESTTIADVEHHARAYDPTTTLIIFDIDNTVATPHHDFGSDQWFSHAWARYKKRGYNDQNAAEQILPLYLMLQNIIALHPVEMHTPLLIKKLQDSHFTVIALTMRSAPIAHRTVEQLNAMHVNFAATAPHKNPMPLLTPRSACYQNGIIFCNGDTKARALGAFLDATDAHPTTIIFIDDKAHYLHNVADFAECNNIHFVGIRYGYCDDRVNNFDHQATDAALTHYLAHHHDARELLGTITS